MFSLNDGFQYWLYTEPTDMRKSDMRKSFYTLSGIVRSKMNHNPLNGDVYIFINRPRNKMKLLHMEPGGLVLYSKVLEKGTFHIPSHLYSSPSSIEWRDLVLMVEGIITQESSKITRVKRVLRVSKIE